MNRGNNGQQIFTCDEDYQYYLDKLLELKYEHPFNLSHYCLMPTHVHFLLKIIKETDFSIFSKRLNLSYAIYFKRNYGSIGHFWQGRFKSQLISNDIYLMQCGKYIELNPVRADMITMPEDYSWSSYQYYAFGKKNSLITEDIFYNEFGNDQKERQKNYSQFMIDEAIATTMSSKKLAIGAKDFVYNINRKNKYHLENKDASYHSKNTYR
jgi:putative transposase